jgi:hypothetical protein
LAGVVGGFALQSPAGFVYYRVPFVCFRDAGDGRPRADARAAAVSVVWSVSFFKILLAGV